MPSSRSHQFVSFFSALTFVGAASATALQAEDVEIDDDRTSTIDTTTLLGNSGTLTITENGSVTVASGTALRLTGNHSLVMQGTLQSDDAVNAIGLGVFTDDLRLTSDINIEGAFVIDGPLGENTATNNIGLGVFGNGIFEGDLTLDEAASFDITGGGARGLYVESGFIGNISSTAGISMSGADAVGIELAGNITGDVMIDGSVSSRNEGGIGILQTGSIDGSFIHQGAVAVGVSETTDDDGNAVDAVPATAGIYVGSDVTGGFMLGGEGADFNDDSDETVATSTISSYGGAPGVLIENLKTDGSDLRVGRLPDDAYGVVHRGTIYSYGQTAGMEAVAFRILGGSNGEKSIIEGGIHIDDGRIDATALDAEAVALQLGSGAEVPETLNRGVIEATTSVTFNDDGNEEYSVGADAIGVDIAADAFLEAFENEGSIQVSASGAEADGYGIRDRSGSLVNIKNTGRIYVVQGTNSSGETIALDLRANSGGVSLENEGTIQGDLLLGSGDDVVLLTDGTFTGDLSFGAGANSFTMRGDAAFSGGISHAGTLNFHLEGADLTLGAADELNVTNAWLSDGATLYFTVDPLAETAGQLNATGTISAAEDVTITALFDALAVGEQTYQIIDAENLAFEGDLVTEGGAFLMHSSLGYTDDGSGVTLTVRPKTSEELGFSGNRAVLYDNLFPALDVEDNLDSALAQLADAEAVENAIQTLMPDTTAASIQMAYGGLQQLEAGLNDRLIEVSSRKRLTGGAWGREVVSFGDMTGSVSGQSLDYLGAGILLGYDKLVGKNILLGAGGGFMLQGARRDTGFGDDVSVFSPYLNVYSIAKAGSAFASASASLWYNNVSRSRELSIATLSKEIESGSSGYTATADFHAGYDLQMGGFHVRPKVGISYLKVHEGGFTETGGDSANMVVESRGYSRLDGVGRVSLGYDFQWSGRGEDGTIVRPEVFASYRKALSGNEPVLTTARFASGEDWFELTNDPIADKVTEFGAALNVFSGVGTASLRYSYEKRDDWKAHSAGFNFQMKF